MALVSPGVQVTIDDQSQYLPSAVTSVPLILLATAQDKANGSGTGVAPATTKANANKLYLVTSQRDLTALYGNPFFYKTTDGTPIQGYELNEYGLLAAYSLLGITNRAYILRADIDLAALVGQVTRPTGAPVDGTFWLDTTNSTWGIQEWNQQTGAFTYKTPIVITEIGQTVQTTAPLAGNNYTIYVPAQSVGNIGDYATVQITEAHYNTSTVAPIYLFYKAGGDPTSANYNTWIGIGFSGAYLNLWPTLTSTLATTRTATGTLFIRAYNTAGQPASTWTTANSLTDSGIPVSIAASDSISTIVTNINAALTTYGLDETLVVSASGTNLVWNIISLSVDSIKLSSQNTTLLADLGISTTAKQVTTLTPASATYQAWAPVVQWGTNAQTPRWRSFDAQPRPTGSVFLKNNNINNGTNLVLSKYSTATSVFTQQSCLLYQNDAAAIAAIDPTGGGAILANTTYAAANTTPEFNDTQLSIFKRSSTGAITYTGANPVANLLPAESMLIQYTKANQSTYTSYATVRLDDFTANTANATITSADLVSKISAAVGTGSPVVAAVNSQNQLTLTHSEGGSIKLTDQTVRGVTNVTFNPLANVTYSATPTITFNSPTFTGTTGVTAEASTTARLSTVVTLGTTGSNTSIVFNVTSATGFATGDIISVTATGQPLVAPAVAAQYTVQTIDTNGAPTSIIATNGGGSGYTNNVPLIGAGAVVVTPGPAGGSASSRTGLTVVSAPLYLNPVATMLSGGSGYVDATSVLADSSYVGGNVITGGSLITGASANAITAFTITTTGTAGSSTNIVLTQAGTGATAVASATWGTGAAFTSFSITSTTTSTFNSTGAISITSTVNGTVPSGTLSGAQVAALVSGFNIASPYTAVLDSGLISKLGFSVGLNGLARYENYAPPSTYTNLVGTPASGPAALFNVATDFQIYGAVTYIGPEVSGQTPAAGIYTIPSTSLGIASGNDIVVYLPASPATGDSAYIVSGSPVLYNATLLSGFTQFTYIANEGAPVTLPANNTQWYYSVVDQIDIMIQDNGIWQGYKNVTMDSRGYNLTQTNPTGPIIATDAPSTQTDGTPLVYGDLWVDSNDLENYPLMFRWENVDNQDQWVPIDSADQTTENGVLFADARWAGASTVDPINDPIPTITSMLTSNYTDPDAPTPTSYPEGMLLFNTRRSGYNIKEFRTNYFTALKYPNANPLPTYSYTWVSTSGLMSNGAPYMGRKAQRAQVVKSLQASIATNMSIREEDTFFNLLACPNYCELQPGMVTLNNDRNNTGYIVGDTPLRLPDQATAITAWATNAANAAATSEDGLVTRDTYLGIYYPSGITTDLTGSNVVVPASHMMLRTILKNDQVAYPWFAPAGTRRGTIDNANNIGYIDAATGEFIVTKNRVGIRDVLYTNFINPLTFFTNVGLLNYGNKNSKDSQSSLDRTNVARLICYLRERLTVLARPFVFEPNDSQTRRDISGVVTTLLADVLSKRGIYDYSVVCDTSNNTPARIDRNELWIDVAIEPAKAVEFIYIPVRILNTGEIAGLGQNG